MLTLNLSFGDILWNQRIFALVTVRRSIALQFYQEAKGKCFGGKIGDVTQQVSFFWQMTTGF